MTLPVKVADIVEQLSIVSDDITVYLNKRTGEFIVLSPDQMLEFEHDEDFASEEDLSDQPEWLKDEVRISREVLNSDDYLALPDSFDIHDWQIMEDFCRSLRHARVREQLLGLIRGRGAFGRFNSAIRSLGLVQAWYQFHDEALEQIAIEWLEENEIPYERAERQSQNANSAVVNIRDDGAQQRKNSKENQAASTKRSRQGRVASSTTEADDVVRKQKGSTNDEIKVFISNRNSHCDECGDDLGTKAWITLERDKGALCLACADLDELVFLPAGDAALTIRSRKYSNLSAVVLKFSKARGRYERQGLLVEERALEQAEAECLADSEVRERRNERARERRAELDEQYVKEFAKRILVLFPNCPAGTEQLIAEHACLKYSGRVGRSAAAKDFDDQMITLAVMAHVRHRETNYDQLLGQGWFRNQARARVRERVEEIAEKWRG